MSFIRNAALAALCLALASCGGWKSSFTEQELSDALYSKETEPYSYCDRECAVAKVNNFSFKLIECNPEVTPLAGLSGPDLRSAETCLVEYTLKGEKVHRKSWVFYRIDGKAIALNHL